MSDTTQNPPAAPDSNAALPPVLKTPPKPKAAAAKAPAGPKYYKVLHGAVGQWSQDAVISSDELVANVHDASGKLISTTPIDIDRLLRLGAIAETSAPTVEPAAEPDE